MAGPWFKSSQTRMAVLGVVKPLTWQGWSVQIGMVFLLAMLAQGIGRWVYIGFQPLSAGVWMLAAIFLLLGVYFRIVRRFSAPKD